MHQILLRTVSNKRTFSIIANISPSLRELFFNKNLITSNLKYDKTGTNNLLLKSNQGREPPYGGEKRLSSLRGGGCSYFICLEKNLSL